MCRRPVSDLHWHPRTQRSELFLYFSSKCQRSKTLKANLATSLHRTFSSFACITYPTCMETNTRFNSLLSFSTNAGVRSHAANLEGGGFFQHVTCIGPGSVRDTLVFARNVYAARNYAGMVCFECCWLAYTSFQVPTSEDAWWTVQARTVEGFYLEWAPP